MGMFLVRAAARDHMDVQGMVFPSLQLSGELAPPLIGGSMDNTLRRLSPAPHSDSTEELALVAEAWVNPAQRV